MIQLSDLHFSYGKKTVLRGISASVEGGTLAALFGPNGCGKTTLFKCCLRLLQVPRGMIRYRGRDAADISTRELSRIAAYVPQDHEPPFPYTVQEIVLMGRSPHMHGGLFGVAGKDKRSSLRALEKVGILDLAESRYDQLSGGQRQLVLIARAIAQETPVLFLDEPTSALDLNNQVRIWRILRTLAYEGITIVACTHEPNHILWYCDRVLVLNRGRILADGPPQCAMTDTTLGAVFPETCSVQQAGSVRVVVPRNHEAGQPASGARSPKIPCRGH
jgi:iron complex transport system ATP-binding protein